MGERSRCTRTFILFFASAGFISAGCAPNGSGAGQELASALCEKAAECCSDGEIRAIIGPYVTSTDCVDRLVTHASASPSGIVATIPVGAGIALPNLNYLDQAIRENRIKVDGDMLYRCTEAINTAECNTAGADAGSVEPTCKPVDPTLVPCDYNKLFVGLVGEEGHCATASGSIPECAEGLFCLNRGVDGVCVPRGKVGDYCFDDGACLTTLYCNQLSGTCQPKRKLGESCAEPGGFAQTDSVEIPCDKYLECDPFARVCVAKCNEGFPCSSDSDCDQTQGLRCIVGYCDSVREENQPCSADNDDNEDNDDEDCSPGLRCEPDGDPTNNYTNVCVPKLADDVTGCLAHADCQSDFCDPTGGTGTCRLKVPPNVPCPSQLHQQCAGGYCSPSGSCEALVADGGLCQYDYQCQSAACVALSCARPPLANGLRCTIDTQCTSRFCNYETNRYCDTKPLDNGKRCALSPSSPTGLNTVCRSDVCLNGICAEGLPAGADCTPAVDKPPCGPMLYCDASLTPWACQPKHGPGDDCTSSAQCFGSCTTMSANFVQGERMICDAKAPPGGLVCGGNVSN
jgi:hypothetical protein